METTHPVPPTTTDLTTLDTESIEVFFAEGGLSVTVVSHCADAVCPLCLGSPFQAARAA